MIENQYRPLMSKDVPVVSSPLLGHLHSSCLTQRVQLVLLAKIMIASHWHTILQ